MEQYTYTEIRKGRLSQKEGMQVCECRDGKREGQKAEGGLHRGL